MAVEVNDAGEAVGPGGQLLLHVLWLLPLVKHLGL